MRRKFILLVLLLLGSIITNAQLHGCLVGTPATGTLYINTDFLGYYQSTGAFYRTSAPFCPRAQLGIRDGDCYFGLLGTRYDRYQYTVITTTSSPVACTLDHYALIAIGVGGLIGYKKMKRGF